MKVKGSFTIEGTILVSFITFIIFGVIVMTFAMYNKVVIKAYASRLAWGIAAEESLGESNHKSLISEVEKRLKEVCFMFGDISIESNGDTSFIGNTATGNAVISGNMNSSVPILNNWIENACRESSSGKYIDYVRRKHMGDALFEKDD